MFISNHTYSKVFIKRWYIYTLIKQHIFRSNFLSLKFLIFHNQLFASFRCYIKMSCFIIVSMHFGNINYSLLTSNTWATLFWSSFKLNLKPGKYRKYVKEAFIIVINQVQFVVSFPWLLASFPKSLIVAKTHSIIMLDSITNTLCSPYM